MKRKSSKLTINKSTIQNLHQCQAALVKGGWNSELVDTRDQMTFINTRELGCGQQETLMAVCDMMSAGLFCLTALNCPGTQIWECGG